MPAVELLYANPNTGKAVVVLSNGDYIQKDVTVPELVNEWCISCGSTLTGRIHSTQKLLGIKQKVPIILGDGWCVIFPTKGVYNEDAIWIMFSRVKKFKSCDGGTLVTTYAGNQHFIQISQRTFSHQMRRCNALINALAQGHEDSRYFNRVNA